MKHDEPAEDVLVKCARRIEEAPVEWQSDLYLITAVLVSKRLSREQITKIIEVSKMEASPLFDGIREKWIDQGKIEVAEKMLLSGMDIDTVVKMTELDRAKVEELKKQLKH